jgi:hypothetical protein
MSGSASGELDFVAFIRQVISSLPEYSGQTVSMDDEDGGADLVVWADGRPAIVEAKADTPKTPERLQNVVEELRRVASAWRDNSGFRGEPQMVLAVPGILPESLVNNGFRERERVAEWLGRRPGGWPDAGP